MKTRAILRSPWGETVARDVVGGRWADPAGEPDEIIGEGLWALPGLFDAHVHLSADDLAFEEGTLDQAAIRARKALVAGVTLVLDKGSPYATTLDLISTIPRSARPEIEAAGHLIANLGGYYPGLALEIEPGEIAAVIEEEARRAAGWVKLVGDWPRPGVGPVPNFDETDLRRAVDAASRAGSRVAIHTMAREVPGLAVAAGVDSVEHGLFLTEDDLGLLGERAGMWVPTVLRVEETLRSLRPGSGGETLIREGLENVERLLRPAVEAGVHVLAGTDLVGSPANVTAEAFRLVELGLPVADALRAVSTGGFVATGRDPTFPVGGDADAMFLPADPLAEIGCITHPVLVMRLGEAV